ncbi:MAG TPA: CRTAC1 family protein [Chthonomonadales bacterium]|nr:CRTAC1 family protein [Chthonomonadales bacterium]
MIYFTARWRTWRLGFRALKRAVACAAVAALGAASGCRGKAVVAPSGRYPLLETPQFLDVTARAGIHWIHNPCRTGKKLLPETVGGGGGFIDYNNDGLMDILLINGAPLPGYHGAAPRLALYRNNGNGTFTDVTEQSGLNFHGYGMGLAVGDYDNDGWPDLFITAVGQCRLYHNDHGHFRDVTRSSGIDVKGFCTGAAWIDYDRDGLLDLFVARYVEWSPATDLPCGPKGARQYCPPNQYKGAPPALFHNLGNGRFEDVSAKAGILGHPSKTLSVTPCDLNDDGWPDLYLANDTEPDVLLLNNQNGTFRDVALAGGVALGTDGNPTGSMGVDIATPFEDNRTAIAVGTFAGQETSLFVGAEKTPGADPLFENEKQQAGIADVTRPMTTFGAAFADFTLDGWPDLILANGHIDDDPSLRVDGKRVTYRQPVQLLMNQRDGTFRDAAQQAGLTGRYIGRGLAIGDFDNDGRPDVLFFENGGPARLWRNVTAPTGNWIGLKLLGGHGSPRDGTGAMVTVYGRGWRQSQFASTSRSFLSACDPRILFGVGSRAVSRVSIRWPSGGVTTIESPPLNRYLTVRQ